MLNIEKFCWDCTKLKLLNTFKVFIHDNPQKTPKSSRKLKRILKTYTSFLSIYFSNFSQKKNHLEKHLWKRCMVKRLLWTARKISKSMPLKDKWKSFLELCGNVNIISWRRSEYSTCVLWHMYITKKTYVNL